MPPSEQPDAPSSGTGPAPAGDMAPPAPQGGGDGSVMVTMPKVAFDAIHALVTQLATGLDQLKQGVDKEASGAPSEPPSEMPPQAPAGGAQGGDDEEFLKGMAAEGSQK